jgi:PiT family inorganic phosphate transporter
MFTLIDRAILRKNDSIGFAKRYSFGFCFITFFLICSSLLLKTPLGKRLNLDIWTALLISSTIALMLAYIGYSFVRRRKIENAEQIFRVLQVITSCYVGFAIGANDVANAIGPIAAVRSIAITGKIAASVPVPFYLLALGGIGIVIGTLTWGYKIIQTVGFKITELTNSRGFSIDFGAATSVLVASKFGLPVSTTHAVVGAVIGVGLARGIDAIDLRIIKNIVVSWVITLPAAAGLAVLVFKILK